MDSITQATLGATVAHAVWHKPLGRKAFLWGAAFGTLPDLDILLYPVLDDIQKLYWHRGESHSVWFILLGGTLLGWLLWRYSWKDKLSLKLVNVGLGLIFATHVLIDYFNVYGTQLLAPFSRYGFGLGNMFIIDPLFTGPLILGLLFAIFSTHPYRFKLNMAGLMISSAYALFSIASHTYADTVFTRQLEEKQVEVKDAITGATPLNSLLWRHVARTDSGLMIGYFSVIGDSPDQDIVFSNVSRNEHILKPFAGQRNVEAVNWFSKGFWTTREQNGLVTMIDMRFGEFRVLPNDPPEKWKYSFAWEITENEDLLYQQPFALNNTRQALLSLWERMINGESS